VAAGCPKLRGIARALALAASLLSVSALLAEAAAAGSGPVAAYPFDEGAGVTLHDLSGRANTGTVSGAAWESGRFGNALSFDGGADAVTVPDSSSLDLLAGMTIEAWVRPRALGGRRAVAAKEQSAAPVYALYASDDAGVPSGHIYALGDVGVGGTSPLPLLTWTHLAVTWDATVLSLYVDGTRVASRLALGVLLPSAGALRIGGSVDGLIDELRIYDRALSAAEIGADSASPVDSAAPSAPSGLAAGDETATSVGLSWTAASDNVTVAGYGIYVDGTRVATATGTSATVTGLACDRSYSFAVDAYDPAGNVSARATATGTTTTCDTGPPSVPAGLGAAAGETSVALSWTASTDDVGVAGYGVYEDGGLIASTAATGYTISGLTCGTMHTFGVDAYDAVGHRSQAAEVTVETTACDITPPTPPAGLVATDSTRTTVSIAWSAAWDDVGVDGYGVYRDGALVGSTTATAYTVAGLECGTSYTVAVDAYDRRGNRSAWATLVVVTDACPPPDTQPPTPPGNLTATLTTQTTITLGWSASTDDTAVAGYGIYQGGAPIGSTAATSYTVGGLACGQTYTFAVDAYDAAGNRSAQASASTSTADCPSDGGASVFLSPTGSDADACTRAEPCRSFDRAYRVAALGDTVELTEGTYGAQNLLFDPRKSGGESDMPDVVFRPAPGATVVVGQLDIGGSRFEGGASHVTIRDLTVDGDVSIPGCGVGDYTPCPPDADSPGNDLSFVDLRVLAPYDGGWGGAAFYCASCSNVSIVGGVWGPETYLPCHGSAHPEIQSASNQVKRANHILIDGATFQNYARCAPDDHTECLQVEPADDVTIRNAIFKRCDTITVNFANDLANSVSAAGFRAPNNVLIENSFFDAAWDNTGGPTWYALNIRECTNCTVRYNSWLQAPRMPTGEISLHNRFVGNAGPMSWAACDVPGVVFAFNVWEGAQCAATDRDVADVGFVDSAAVDLHLRAGSPAIDAGDPSLFPAVDIDGELRPIGGAPDAGADETAAGAGTALDGLLPELPPIR
jgi:chitodextrinase